MPGVPIPDTLKGPAFMVGSCVIFGVIWVLIRMASETVHTFEIVFFRSVFGMLALVPFYMRSGWHNIQSRRWPLHFARGVLSLIATFGIFYAVAHVALADVVAISYAAPIFASIGAVFVLGEKVRIRRAVALAIGFAGVMIVLRPGIQDVTPGMWAALGGSVAIAGSLLVIKRLSSTDAAQTIAFYSFLAILPFSALAAWPVWVWPDAREWALLIGIGVLVSIAHTWLARAFAYGEVGQVMPFDFVRLLVATFFGYIFFGEGIDWLTIAGATVILASTIYTANREAALARAERRRTVHPPAVDAP